MYGGRGGGIASQYSIWHRGKIKWKDDKRSLGLCFSNGRDRAGVGKTPLQRIQSEAEEAFQERNDGSEHNLFFLELKNAKN